DGFPFLFHSWFGYHVGQTLFHVAQVVLGYMVMLAVMSYNAWIFLGAIAGSTLGYFV
ncbi:putative low affinity copper uptake protein 2, partial [Pterocles gutturalis]